MFIMTWISFTDKEIGIVGFPAHLLRLHYIVKLYSHASNADRPNGPEVENAATRATVGLRRGGVWGELALAVPPTIVILIVILAIEGITRQRLLFASLASSAFLIYYAPLDRTNAIRVMVTAQALGCALGVIAGLLLGDGYMAGALAMVITILLLITFDVVHPPAISTALGFAFVTPKDRTLLLFAAAIVLLGVLVVLQHIAVWTMHRIGAEVEP